MRGVRLRPGSGGRKMLLRRRPLASEAPAVKRPGLTAAAALVTLFLIAGLYWPHAGDGLARLLVAALAVGYLGFRAYGVVPPVLVHPHSPFGREPQPLTAEGAPLPLARLTRALNAAAGTRGPTAGRIPASVATALREEGARRLMEGHRLDLADPRDHPRIRALISEPTWVLLRPADAASRPPARGAARAEAGLLALSQLDSILDDLERL